MAKEFIVYSKTKAEFEALVSSGEVDTSQMGIIAETGEMWWNGEYRPLAETVPFANDLTGRIEATPEEFTFRPSAGDKSIRDESALIKRIKGNTIVWNQLFYPFVKQLVHSSGLTFTHNGDGTISIKGTIVNTTGVTWPVIESFPHKTIIGHKYLFGVDKEMPHGFSVYLAGVGSLPTYTTLMTIGTCTSESTYGLYIAGLYNQVVGTVYDYTGRGIIVDLTQMFGAGNEPTTVEEFKALFPNDHYDYNAGELVSMTSNGLFANGFNQWDEEWERGYLKADGTTGGYVQNYIRAKNYTPVIGGAVYYANVPNGVSDAQLYAVDENYNLVKHLYPWINTQFQIPNGAKYIRFYMNYGSEVYNNNININLSHTGVRNGEYEPYWDATKDLSIIQKYFPNGMRSAGSIYDEISFDETTQKWVAIQRVGERAFIEGDKENTQVITDDTNTHYELEESIITTIEEPIDLSYKIGDFGTEKMLSDAFSAPFKADIIYQFNAVDRVRENSSNISKLTKKHASLTNDIEGINTEIGLVGEDIAALDDKIVIVSNEVGTVKTTANSAVTKAEAAASRANYAQASADNALAYAQEEIEKTNAEVDDAQEDILDLKGLIGEEYSIWFEPDGQENTVPTLDNYPASDWATDDDYSAHDRDLYYSISLGRAWRFNYNEGSPFWEDITDSYTITALNKAQQALDKAQAAVDAVNGLQYIVSSFPEDNVLNTSAVILGKLVTVKDENSNVVAGLYGGGNEELNNSGYSDDEHGALMVFAGASSASTVAEADYRVYEDGTTYMNKGIFSGLSKYNTVTINNLNVNEYFPISTITADTSNGTTVTQHKLSVNSISAITTFSSGFTGANIAIHLPAIYNYTLYDSLDTFTKETLREMVGNTFYIYNYSSSFIYLCGYLYDPTENVFSGPACRADGIIDKGEFAKVACVLDIDASGREVVYWQYKVGRHSMIELSPNI